MVRQSWRLAAMIAAAVAFGLGIYGFVLLQPGTESATDLIYHTLQLFVLGSDPLQEGGPYNVPLEISRLLAPATTAFAAFEALRALLGEELRRRKIARRQGHAIVCGDGPAAMALARNLQSDGPDVVLVSSADGPQPRGERIAVVPGDPRQATTLRAAGVLGASFLYACAPQSATNAAVVLAAGPLRNGRRGRLTAYAQLRNDDLVEALRVHQVANPGRRGFTIEFFAIEDTAARLLLDRHTPGDGSVPIVIVGFASFGRALLRAIVRRPAEVGQRRTVLVGTVDPASVVEVASQLDAAERGCDVTPIGAADPIPAGVRRIYVCMPDEDAAVGHALRLSRQAGREVVVCLPQAAPFDEALGAAPPVFGILDAACRADTIAEASIFDRTARAIHENYRADCARRGDTPASNPSMRPWQDLPAYLQESNYAQAEHIGAKLMEIGATLATRPVTGSAFTFTEDEIDTLARAEHKRWMNERLAGGYSYGPRREGKRHPDLVDWLDLSPESRQKDVDAVTHLPDLLAAAGLHIGRRPHP